MRRERLPGYIGIRVPVPMQEAITSLADKKELAIAELAREYLLEGLRRDGITC
ncbi:MAG: hypothetical protein NTV25_04250 [Methanothrix sp.]|nr:hypothetical protein [Methanothrix sp.]